MADLDTNDTPELDQAAVQRYESETQGSALTIKSLEDVRRLSNIFVGSGMFKPDKQSSSEELMYQAGVKIIAGVEFGIQPFAAMRGINIIKGNAEMSANLMAAKVKSHPKYDYKVKQWDKDGCVLTFYEIPYPGAKRAEWDELGDSSFDGDDAKTAGLMGDNWRKFARNMYFARAMSNGVRIYCPDIFYGAPVYVEGEISGEEPKQVDAEAQTEQPAEPVKDEPAEAEIVTDEVQAEPEKETAQPTNVKPGSLITTAQIGKIHILSNEKGLIERIDRQQFISQVIDRDVESSKELTKDEARRIIDALTEYERQDDDDQN